VSRYVDEHRGRFGVEPICKTLATVAWRTDVARLDFHDLRHTFASLMIAAGANPLQLAEALGHSDQYGRPDPTLVWKVTAISIQDRRERQQRRWTGT
jgi:integrase